MDEIGEAVRLSANQGRVATGSAALAIDDDADQAAKSMELSKITGVPAPVIHNDYPTFHRNTSVDFATRLIENNPKLQDYANSHPLASTVSNDDWGQLDKVSELLKKSPQVEHEPHPIYSSIPDIIDFTKEFFHGLAKAPGQIIGTAEPEEQEKQETQSIVEYLVRQGIDERAARVEASLLQQRSQRGSGLTSILMATAPVGLAAFLTGQGIFRNNISRPIEEQTGFPKESTEAAAMALLGFAGLKGLKSAADHQKVIDQLKEVHDAVAPYVEAGEPPPIGIHPIVDKMIVEQSKQDLKGLDEAFKEAQGSSTRERSPELFSNFIKQHTDASIGISADAIRELYKDKEPHPEDNILGWVPGIVDKLREAEATGGHVEIPLADWLSKADPEIAKELHDDIRVRPGGVTKNEAKELAEQKKVVEARAQEEQESIKAAALRLDNGQIFTGTNHGEAWLTAKEAIGTDPIGRSGFVTSSGRFVDRGEALDIATKAEQIKRDVVRETGLTTEHLEEKPYTAEEGAEEQTLASIKSLLEMPDDDPSGTGRIVRAIRTQAALDPLFQEGPIQQLNIKRAKFKSGMLTADHTFAITDEQGRSVGQLLLNEQKGGKDLYIEWIGGAERILNSEGGVDNVFGPRLIADLARQLKSEFPGAEYITGHRTSGAREKAGTVKSKGMVRIPIKALREEISPEDIANLVEILKEGAGEWESFGGTVKALMPTEEWTKHEQKIIDAVDDVLDRIIPNKVETTPAREVRHGGREVGGLHLQYEEDLPLIVWSLSSKDPLGTAKHEAMHQLRQYQFFTKEEWTILEDAAVNNEWFEKHQIDERYPGEKFTVRLEEAIAEEFKDWDREPKSDHPVAKIFQKLKDLLDKIRLAIKDALGYEPTWQDLFKKAESGEIGRREGEGPLNPESFRAQEPELPGMTRQEDLDLFAKARDIGMNAKQYKRYQELIERRDAEDIEAQLKRSLKDEEKKQTKEWKENETRVRDEVKTDIEQRPDIGVARFFGEGMLYGEKLDHRPKLSSEKLTEEQKKGLPESILSDTGIDPDDVAGLFGYRSGAEMVDKLVEQTKAREGQSLGKFVAKEIERETDLRMEKQFGDLDQNILSEARDHVLSTTQMDLLHEETVALGMQAGSEMPFSKKDVKSWVEGEFDKANAKGVKSSKYLDTAGKAGRLAELALLDGEPLEAFKQKQRQYFSALLAREAKKFEKEKAQFDRQMKKFSKREVSGVEQEFTNFVHSLMIQAEIKVNRAPNDIAYEIEKSGHTSFEGFVAEKSGAGWELGAPDDILAGEIKSVDQMSVQEFREFRDVTKSLEHIGREVSKLEIAGRKEEFADWKGKVLENITELPPRLKEKQRNILFGFDAEMTRMEEIVKDLDLRRELGPLYNGLIRPMMEGKHKEFQLQEKLVKSLAALREGGKEWRKTLKDSIPQDFFIDPDTQLPFDLNREQLINIAMNFGNRSSVEKFTKGWFGKDRAGAAERQLLDLFDKHLTDADYDFMKKLSGIFEEWKPDSDNMYRNLSGIAPKWLDIEDGGWYWPVMYDRYYSDINATIEKKDTNALMGSNYFRATTANGYTNTRTGYIGRIEFQNPLEQLATRMQQVIHDISYRPAVMQAAKIIYDKEIKAAIRKHYGSEYEAQLDPWLRSIANHYNINEREISQTNAMLRRLRMNLVVNALGLNLKQLGTPDVGVLTLPTLWRAAKFLDDDTKFAMDNSKEIPHTMKVMDRDFRESLDRSIASNGYEGMQATAARFAFMPMAQLSKRFRVSTFTERYKDARARGLDHADAVEVADAAVRERHGSTGLPDMPAIMRGSETRKLITLFYGFGNATYNWQRQIPGAVRRGDWNTAMAAAWGAVIVPTAFGIAFYNSRKENDGWFKIISKGLALQLGQTVVHARDIINYGLEDQSPRSPLASAAMALKAAANDAWKAIEGKGKITKPIQHTANVIGIAAGLPGAQIGRTSQFVRDVATGQQRPRNLQEYIRGIIHGEARLKK